MAAYHPRKRDAGATAWKLSCVIQAKAGIRPGLPTLSNNQLEQIPAFVGMTTMGRSRRDDGAWGTSAHHFPGRFDLAGVFVFFIFQCDAHGGQFIADAVAFFEVFGFACGGASGDQRINGTWCR